MTNAHYIGLTDIARTALTMVNVTDYISRQACNAYTQHSCRLHLARSAVEFANLGELQQACSDRQ